MRKEAIEIYRQLEDGKPLADIKANQKTKSRVNRMFLYRKVIDALQDDMMSGKYTFSIYDLQKLLNKKKPAA